jgi:heme exporter protein A
MGRGTTTIDSGVDHFNKILDRLGLTPYRSFPAKILSQGQRRRLALARLLVADKPLWIMDEPFTALDVRSCRLISELLAQHLARGGMAIISSHQEFDIAGTAPSRIDLDALRTPSPYQWNDAGSAQPASAGQYPT